MFRTRRITAALAALAMGAGLALTTALPAFAVTVPARDNGTHAAAAIVRGGMPGWQIAVIAIGAALAGAILTAAADRARAARRRFAPAG